MHEAVAVRFRFNPKELWFDPNGVEVHESDHLIVSTERGQEICLAVTDIFEASDEDIKSLPGALKPVLRVADEDDLDRANDLARKSEEALPVFRSMVEERELDIKPVRVEYLFSGEKAVFYFASEERVDFRELVRELASHFHIRVDMRQIGVRDEARLVGGLSHCGQELCCTRLGGEFQPVSIRMAKEQDLPLNPQKISGLCGRLMCCLRYEFEAYKDFKDRAPKKNALIETPMGLGKVVEFNTPREIITLRFEDGKEVKIPVSEMECDEGEDGKSTRPCRITEEKLKACLDHRDFLSEMPAVPDRELADGVVETKPRAKRTPRRRSGGKSAGAGAPSPRAQAQPAGGRSRAEHARGAASAEGTAQTAERGRTRRRRSRGSAGSGTQAQGRSTQQAQGRSPSASGEGRSPQQRAHDNRAASPDKQGGQRDRNPSSRRGSGGSHASGGGRRQAAASHQQTGAATSQAPKRQPRRRHNAQGDSGAGSDNGGSAQ